jgi:Domain of unknown function (DUF4491)
MNLFGLGMGLATLAIIGLGFVWVIRIEYHLGYLWWPYVLAAGLGLVAASTLVANTWGSAIVGIVGASIAWGATELKEQAVRAELGWYPFNPGGKPRPPLSQLIERLRGPHL